MTILNTETGELIPQMSADDARRITERIRLTATSARESLDKLQTLMAEAQQRQVHVTLGYASWTAYIADVFSDEPLRLPRDQRQELVGYLAGEGMSTRAIAPIVGQSHMTVARDLAGVTDVTPVPHSPQVEPTIPTDVETSPAAEAVRPAVTGLDGKTYVRPEPTAPRATPRRALPDQFFDAAYDLTKAIERVQRLAADDRFPQNAEKVAAKHRSDLLRSRDLLEQVINALPTTEESTRA